MANKTLDPKIDSVRDFTDKGLRELESWLEPWFKGHLKGVSGGGGNFVIGIEALWQGYLPSILTTGPVWMVPYLDAVALTFDLTLAFARVEDNSQASDVEFLVQRSPGGGTFTPTLISTLTIPAGDYEVTDTPSLQVTSGQLLRIVFNEWGTISCPYTVQVEGIEAA